MKLEELFEQIADSFKVPETLEEAIEYINKDPSMQTLIEEMAFRQVVINILVAANIITEKDFNESVKHFKNLFTKSFAQELISKLEDFNKQYSEQLSIEPDDNIDDFENEDEIAGKA